MNKMAWDKTWENVFSSQVWGKYPGEDTIRFIARNYFNASERSQIKILEIGCGPGANLWFLAREGFCTYGIDGSISAIDLAKKRLDDEVGDWQGKVLHGDFLNLPFEGCFFDAVIDIEAITHNSFEDSILAYSEVHRVLKPGGKLYSRTFAKGTIGDETGEVLGYNSYLPSIGPMSGKGLTRFTAKADVSTLLKGFSLVDIGYLENGNDDGVHTKEWMLTAVK